MGWKEFFASIINSIIWPSSIIIITYHFKEDLKLLLGKISSFTFGSTSAKFSDDLSEITENIEDSEKLIKSYNYKNANNVNIEKLTIINPALSVIESFRRFENSVNSLYESEEFKSHYDDISYSDAVAYDDLINELTIKIGKIKF